MPIGELPRRNPEPTPEQLRKIFTSQDQTGRVRLLNPSPRTSDELLRRSQKTYLAVSTAYSFSRRMTSPDTLKPNGYLIGGVGCAVATGEVYREHSDVDFLIPEDYFTSITPELESIHGPMKREGRDIYRVNMLPFYGDPDFLKMMADPQKRKQLEANRVQVDFFVCRDGDGQAFFSGGSYPDINLDVDESVSEDGLLLFGMPFYTVLPTAVMKLKELDAKSRQKGKVDLYYLKAH